jgi:hypothetical protein
MRLAQVGKPLVASFKRLGVAPLCFRGIAEPGGGSARSSGCAQLMSMAGLDHRPRRL